MSDILDEQEPDDFEVEDDQRLSKEVYKQLKEQKQFYKKINEKQINKEKKQHRATFTRKDNKNQYVCDYCGKTTEEEDGSIIYCKGYNKSGPRDKEYGEYFYCNDCLKIIYPGHTNVKLASMVKKSDYMSNHADTRYSKGFK